MMAATLGLAEAGATKLGNFVQLCHGKRVENGIEKSLGLPV
jgi:hypothetical protein